MVAPHTDSQFVSGKQSLWIDQRWRPTDASDKDSNRSEAKLLANHHLVNGELSEATDYAEVDPQNLTTFYNTTNKGLALHPHPQTLLQLQQQQMLAAQQQPDLTPYATTTLIQRRPNYVSLSKDSLSTSNEMFHFIANKMEYMRHRVSNMALLPTSLPLVISIIYVYSFNWVFRYKISWFRFRSIIVC